MPDDSVHTFLERLDELKVAYRFSDEDMLRAIPQLLKGLAYIMVPEQTTRLEHGQIPYEFKG
jgi:hypothetical protein